METSLPLFPDPLPEPSDTLLLGKLHLEKNAMCRNRCSSTHTTPYTLGAGREVGGAKAVELPEVE